MSVLIQYYPFVKWLKQLEENGVDALETDKKGRPTSEYISFTKS
ncbi:hypothetical protein [Bacillus sp. B4EP4a]|nr:hypothetical protein [Bacillus sp. B4EP4a]